jgi:hypothetical protein
MATLKYGATYGCCCCVELFRKILKCSCRWQHRYCVVKCVFSDAYIATVTDGIWSNGGMILAGENRSTRGDTSHSANLFTRNPTWTDVRSNPILRGEWPATNGLRHGTAFRLLVVFTLSD